MIGSGENERLPLRDAVIREATTLCARMSFARRSELWFDIATDGIPRSEIKD